MDINNLNSQPKTFLQQELIGQQNEQRNQIIDQERNIKSMNIKAGKKFQYKLLKSQKQNNNCTALAFNRNGNILFAVCQQSIIVYFNCNTSKMLLKLTNHPYKVYYLCCMKKSNSIVSINYYYSITIWELENISKWTRKTQLKEHTHLIFCILMNNNEDLLISSSYDNTVKFWRKIDNKWSFQQTIELEDFSCSLSLNEQEEKLISCGNTPFIQVMQMKQDKTWSIVQTIEIAQGGRRLYFLNDNKLIFQPYTKDFIEMYYFDNQLRQFKKHKNIQVQSCKTCDWFFPIQFFKDLKFLTVKHGQFLNIFKVQDNGDINLIQTIEFNDESLYGNFTNDGKYLVTWDFNSKEIQIRHLIYLE